MTLLAQVKKTSWQCAGVIAAALLLISSSRPAQSQQSLADIARQARAQKQGQAADDANRAQQVADEISEEQNDGGAPGGFKTYNAGDYKLWVPAPYKVEGHDDAGTVLDGPAVGGKHSIVLVGTPIVAQFGENEDAFQNTAAQFVHLYAQSSNCTKSSFDNHGAYECSMAAANLLGQLVSGNAIFVRAAGYVYPVFCVAPSDSRSRDLLNGKRVSANTKTWARESLDREEDDIKKVLQSCETVFHSIHIHEGAAPQQKTAVRSDSPVVDKSAGAADAKPIAAPAHVEVAANPTAQTQTQPASTVPAGFKIQAFSYCKNINECWDASVLVPADAKLVSSDCKQYVFETKVQGAPFLLLVGPAGTDGCNGRNPGSQVRWKQLVDPESERAPGTSSTISAQQTKVDGKTAVITQLRFTKGLANWISKRAEVENNGAGVVVGCMAPTDIFADGDAVCTGLIGSLRLP